MKIQAANFQQQQQHYRQQIQQQNGVAGPSTSAIVAPYQVLTFKKINQLKKNINIFIYFQKALILE